MKRSRSTKYRRPLKRTRHVYRRYNRFGGRVGRRLTSGTHFFKRNVELAQLQFNNVSTDNTGAYVFTLGDLPNYAEFTALFDEYMMCAISISFVPAITGMDGNPIATTVSLPNFCTVIDHDDNTAPTNLATILQYENFKRTRLNVTHTRYFVPRIAVNVYRAGLTSGFGSRSKQWIDCSNTDIAHYGLKYVIDPIFNSGSELNVQVFATYYMKFRGVR